MFSFNKIKFSFKVKIVFKTLCLAALFIFFVFYLVQSDDLSNFKKVFAFPNLNVTDTFDDELKIASKNNLTISGGQVSLGDCSALGCVCSSGDDCDSGYCYRDADGDGYAVLSGEKICKANASFLEMDCYDANVNANPGQTNYFTVHRGDGSFDYNCNSAEEKQWVQGYSSCYLSGLDDVLNGVISACNYCGVNCSRYCTALRCSWWGGDTWSCPYQVTLSMPNTAYYEIPGGGSTWLRNPALGYNALPCR